MKSAVIVFPGSNCDRDVAVALEKCSGKKPEMVWHGESALPSGVDLVVLPGGFSYGDYLRCGAIANFANIMPAIKAFVQKGGYVLGICNGFQILVESHLLPGALMRNRGLKFVCRDVHIRTENNDTAFTKNCGKNQVLRIPVAHHDGNYFVDAETQKAMNDNGQIVFRYATEAGEITESANPNGALDNIAGIVNAKKNVLGMMPHPERLFEPALGGTDGKFIFESILTTLK